LLKLRDLAVHQDRIPEFQTRLAELQAEYARRPALLERLRRVAAKDDGGQSGIRR
jgi:hypothetical protein